MKGKDEEEMFSNLKVWIRLVLLTAVAAISMCAMGFLNMKGMEKSYQQSVSSMEEVLYKDYDEQIKGQVGNVITLLEKIYEESQAGVYSEEEAKKLAADMIRELRYEASLYTPNPP